MVLHVKYILFDLFTDKGKYTKVLSLTKDRVRFPLVTGGEEKFFTIILDHPNLYILHEITLR